MTIYYIDPFLGNDSNTGLTWAQSLRTFLKFNFKEIELVTGDEVRLAKTPTEEVVAGFLYPAGLSGHQINLESASCGWRCMGFTPDATIQASFQSVFLFESGAVAVNSTVSYLFDGRSQTFGEPTYTRISDRSVSGEKMAYAATPSTRNLSGFARLEVGLVHAFTNTVAAVSGKSVSIRIDLCSDLTGDVPLLQITAEPGVNNYYGGVFGFEGTLPDGVNSVSIWSGTVVNADAGNWHLRSMVATRALSDPAYVGLKSVAKLGTHEAALWHRVERFTETGISITANLTGPASIHTTNVALKFRKAEGWAGQYISRATTFLSTSAQLGVSTTATPAIAETNGGQCGLFVQHYLVTNLTITGGYNKVSGLVDGQTFLTLDMLSMLGTGMPAGAIVAMSGGSSLVDALSMTVSNLVVVSNGSHVAHWTDKVDSLTFNNCEITARQGNWITSNRQFTGASGQDPWPLNITFNNSKGTLYIAHQHITTVAVVTYLTLNSCIIASHAHSTSRQGQYSNPQNTTLTSFTGGLKIYCVGSGSSRINTRVNTSNRTGLMSVAVLPNFRNGCTGTLSVFGGGGAILGFFSLTGAYEPNAVMPPIVLENTQLDIGTPYVVFNNNAYSGPQTITLTSVTMSFARPYSAAMTTGWESSFYPYALFYCTEVPSTPPVSINSCTVTGTLEYSLAGHATAVVGFWQGAGVHIKSFDASALLGKRMIIRETHTVEEAEVSQPALVIVESAAIGSSEPAQAGITVCAASMGHTDLRNVSVSYTGTGMTLCEALAGTLRLVGCGITNANATSVLATLPSQWQTTVSGTVPQPLNGYGLILKDTPIPLAGLVSSRYGVGSDLSDIAITPVVSHDTATGAYLTYLGFASLERDYASRASPPSSWRSTLRRAASSVMANLYPLTSVPVSHFGQVDVRLSLRRDTSTPAGVVALVVMANGATGSTGDDFFPIEAPHTAGSLEWQEVLVSFTALRSTSIDIYVAHYGSTGSVAWFDNLKVSET
jgi:hypothetical protein